MKFDDKEDMQIPAHGRELDRGRIGLFKIFLMVFLHYELSIKPSAIWGF